MRTSITVLCEARYGDHSLFFFAEESDEGDYATWFWSVSEEGLSEKEYVSLTSVDGIKAINKLKKGMQIAFWLQEDRNTYHSDDVRDSFAVQGGKTQKAFFEAIQSGEPPPEKLKSILQSWHWHLPEEVFDE